MLFKLFKKFSSTTQSLQGTTFMKLLSSENKYLSELPSELGR